jgi:hypothetical protein
VRFFPLSACLRGRRPFRAGGGRPAKESGVRFRERGDADCARHGRFGGKLVSDRTDIVLRSPELPDMKFNQFPLMPYFGPCPLPKARPPRADDRVVGPARPAAAGGE